MLGSRFHYCTYLTSIALLTFGISTSEFLMSVASIALAANWLLEGKFREKFQLLWQRKVPIALSLIFLIYLIWMAGTSNIDEGLKELRLRLPLLLFPVVLGSIQSFSPGVRVWIIRWFIFSTFISTAISVGVYLRWLPSSADLSDIRNISVFISHIRLSLLICVSIVCSLYFVLQLKQHRLVYVLAILWFVGFLYLIQSATGFVILFILIPFFAFFIVKRQQSLVPKLLVALVSAAMIGGSIYYVIQAKNQYFEVQEVQCNTVMEGTAKGEPYFHDLDNTQLENNNYIWRNIHFESMREAWNERSDMDVSGKDNKGQQLEATLIRYLTSKGVCKDRDGVEALTEEDIRRIENGSASVVQDKIGINKRLDEIFWEFNAYHNGGNPGGNSVVMRLEFWKTARALIRDNFWFGVGTGDGKQEMQATYERTQSVLDKKWHLGSHNEYLSTLVKTGVVGFAIFIFALVYPLFYKRHWNFLYLSFFAIAILSFAAENTLETQPGVAFFGFFNAWMLFQGLPTKTKGDKG